MGIVCSSLTTREHLLLVVVLILSLFISPSRLQADSKHTYLVRFRGEESIAQVDYIKSYGFDSAVIDGKRIALRIKTTRIDPLFSLTSESPCELLGGEVSLCEYDFPVYSHLVPSDPSFPAQWGLDHPANNDVNAPEAWNITTGSENVYVGVIDTGADLSHPDLVQNIWRNAGEIPGNGIDDDADGYIDDVSGYDFFNRDPDPSDDSSHGTHVAGIIGGRAQNGIGVSGVNWKVKLIPVKFLGSGGAGSVYGVVSSIDFLINLKKRKGLNIVAMNGSFGGGGRSEAMAEAISRARDAGILFVVSAGNFGTDLEKVPSYPASYDFSNVIPVAATDQQGRLASFSSYGRITVDIGAPGVSILSTIPGGYASYSGTSMAAPFVTGALALTAARYPGISSTDLKAKILGNGAPLGSLESTTSSGKLLDLYGSLIGQRVPRETVPTDPGGPVPTPGKISIQVPSRKMVSRHRYRVTFRSSYSWVRPRLTIGGKICSLGAISLNAGGTGVLNIKVPPVSSKTKARIGAVGAFDKTESSIAIEISPSVSHQRKALQRLPSNWCSDVRRDSRR